MCGGGGRKAGQTGSSAVRAFCRKMRQVARRAVLAVLAADTASALQLQRRRRRQAFSPRIVLRQALPLEAAHLTSAVSLPQATPRAATGCVCLALLYTALVEH